MTDSRDKMMAAIEAKKKAKAPKAEAAKKPKPKQAPKPSGPKTESRFSKFAQHTKEEFKNATDEIKPKALLGHAADSLKSIKNMVNRGEGDEDRDRTSEDSVDRVEDESPVRRRATEELSTEVRPEEVFEAHSAKGNADDGAPVEFSAAKVQRAPKKKPKAEPEEAAPVEFSAAKVQRAPKKKTEEVAQDDEITVDFKTLETGEDEDEPTEFSAVKVDKVSSKKNPAEDSDEEELEEPDVETETEEAGPSAEDQYEELAEETETAEETNGEPEAKKATQKSKEPGKERGPSKIVHKHAQAAARMSKKDQAIKSFESLQIVLKNELWKSVIVDPDSKPSTLFLHRDKLDENFADATFSEGLKAANRLAASFSFDPDNMEFNQKVIEHVVAFTVDPEGKVKRDTDSPSKLIDEDHLKKLFGIIKDPQCRRLFYSVGTRLGEFVPTIEILARIYIAMRKKADINPGERFSITEEVLMRYKKSPYTDSKGKKARNLAVNYFTDFLAGYGMRQYKERFAQAPDGQNNIEGQLRRHKVIKSHCFHLFEQRGTRIGLSQPALINLKARFSETADNYLKSLVADIPDEVFEEMNEE